MIKTLPKRKNQIIFSQNDNDEISFTFTNTHENNLFTAIVNLKIDKAFKIIEIINQREREKKMKEFKLWETTPALEDFEPTIEYHQAENKTTDACVVIFPGGGYSRRSPHEGGGYAEFFNSLGMDAFVLQYRVSPYHFPIELLDARRSIRWVRQNAEKFNINPDKIGVIGSSAGGHLAAMLCTYKDSIEFESEDEIDNQNYMPAFQILCYPVICISDLTTTHIGSCINLFGEDSLHIAKDVDPSLIADSNTPKAFIWHTSNDPAVNVCNSLRYGERLRSVDVQFEMHIFPDGHHGLGLAQNNPHAAQWSGLLANWLKENNLL